MTHATPLYESQFGGISYEHTHTPCVPVLSDCCNSFDHDVVSWPLLDRPHRLEALVAFHRELYLHNLLKTDPSLRSPTPEVRSCEDFGAGSEALIPLVHNFLDDTHCDEVKEVSDP